MREYQLLLQYFFKMFLTFQKEGEKKKKAIYFHRLVAALDCPRVMDAKPKPCVDSLKLFLTNFSHFVFEFFFVSSNTEEQIYLLNFPQTYDFNDLN